MKRLKIALGVALLALAYACGMLFGHHQYVAILQDRFDDWGKMQVEVIRILRDMKRQGVAPQPGRLPAVEGESAFGRLEGGAEGPGTGREWRLSLKSEGPARERCARF